MAEPRVLHVVAGLSPRFGGTTTAVLGWCGALAASGRVAVELAATDADTDGRRLPPTATAGLPYPAHLFAVDRDGRWLKSAALVRWLDGNVGRFDLVHVHGAWSHPCFAARRAAQRAGVRYVYSPHGMLSRYTFSRRRALKVAYWLAVERATVRGAALVLATTAGEAAELARLPLPAPAEVVPLGVDADGWAASAEPDALRRRVPDARDRPIVLFLSRLHPKKGVADLLLPALARVRQPVYLAIAGGTDDTAPAYGREVADAVGRLGLSDRVGLLGPVAPADRWGLFDGAAVFVLPSHQENFGLVVAEAMARRCPVVVSDQVQTAPHVIAAGAGKVVRRDPAELAAALDGLLADPAGRAAAGDRGHEYARQHFTWDRAAAAVADLSDRVLGGGRS